MFTAANPARGDAWLWLIVALFGGLRALALRNDLWMDEIRTLWHLQQLGSVTEIFSRFVFDNNHPLNSLWMLLVLPLKIDWSFRLLSWFGGTAGIWLAAKVARLQLLRLHPDASAGQTRAVELITAALFGGSYLMVVYSSEARGYGPALGFALLGIYALLRGATLTFGKWTVVYWTASVLGALAHAVTYQLIAAAVVFTGLQALRERTSVTGAWSALVRWHALPVAFGILYYVTFVRHLAVVGGPDTPIVFVLGELATYCIGLPHAWGITLALPLMLGGVILALVRVWLRSPPLACYYVMGMFAFPAAALSVSRFIYLFPRYFILSGAAALLLIGYLGSLAWNRGRLVRSITIALVGLILLGNLSYTAKLLRYGRGDYKSALRYIAAHTPPGGITLSSDHDGRNVLVIYHHAPIAMKPRTMDYFARTELPPHGTQWLLAHRLDNAEPPGPDVTDDHGDSYRLEKIFPHAPLSGWDWYVYRNKQLLPSIE